MQRAYVVNTTIYTGIASGFTIETGTEGGKVDWGSVNNRIDNLISVIKSKSTLRNVSLRLYAQQMIYGDSLQDNNYIRAENYRSLVRITPKNVLALIDKSSEEKTIENLNSYEKASPQNFVYGLFNWYHRHFSYSALSNIQVSRIYDSDMLQIQYSSDDPGVAYNTLKILNDEFVKQYELLRYGETNNVVEYFRTELARLGAKLRESEDSLTQYYVDKRVINYPKQTEMVTALTRDYDLIYNATLLKYTSSSQMVEELEKKIKDQTRLIESNTIFIDKLNNLAKLSEHAARLKTFKNDTSSVSVYSREIDYYNKLLAEAENDLKSFTKSSDSQRYTKEGIATTTFVDQWIAELILREKSGAELKVMDEVKRTLEKEYTYFAPIGSIINRKEREINITEQSYLSLLSSLNTALMRQKTLEMSSATLKAIDPPVFPVSPSPSKRKTIVLVSYFGTLILILGFFILVELIDRTVRDKNRAERLIPAKVLGVFPRKNVIRFKGYNREYEKIATNYLANSIVTYLNPKERPDIINFISSDSGVGKSHLCELLSEYWIERGLRIRVISWEDDISPESREYILSLNLTDLFDYDNEDIIIVEHRSVLKSTIPVGLLREASLNLFVVRADKVWREIDKIAFERLIQQAQSTPVHLYLTNVKRENAESFMGMLPPYSRFREFIYKIIQFGLTSK
ncbi:MAG: exopolysaccharide biosynthesis protein [Bacteroidales bacterium]